MFLFFVFVLFCVVLLCSVFLFVCFCFFVFFVLFLFYQIKKMNNYTFWRDNYSQPSLQHLVSKLQLILYCYCISIMRKLQNLSFAIYFKILIFQSGLK